MEIGRGTIAFLKNRHSRTLLTARCKLLLIQANVTNILKQGTTDISAPLNNKAWNAKSDLFESLEPPFGFTYVTVSEKK
jgi:hypothetical protein